MHFFVKLAASTVGVLCTTATAYLFVDEKKRYGVVFAATSVQSPSGNSADLNKTNQGSLSLPIRSSEQWNWNWDGYVIILVFFPRVVHTCFP